MGKEAPDLSSPPHGEPVSSAGRNLWEALAWRLRVTPAIRRVVTERVRQERWAREDFEAWFPLPQGGELRRLPVVTRSVGPSRASSPPPPLSGRPSIEAGCARLAWFGRR